MPHQYVNRKGWHSCTFQLVCDSRCIIRDVFGGFPGCTHDAFLFENSSFSTFVREEIPNPYVVVGDAAYPNLTHMITPFKGTLTQDEEIFNKRLSSQRMCIERTIGLLKGRFKRFRMPSKNGEKSSVINMFLFACIIHNYIIINNFNQHEEYLNEFLLDPGKYTDQFNQ